MKKFGLIAAALGGIATAGLAKFYAAARAYETERAAGKFDDTLDDDVTETDEEKTNKPAYEIVWANGQLSSAVSSMIEDAKANGKRTTIDELFADDSGNDREPLFGMNERVTIVNPYEMAAWVDIETETPMEYRITDMEFDMQDAVWRYKLAAGGVEDDRWYSEEWLEAPLFTQMTKSQSEVDGMTDKVAGMTEEERREFWADYNLAKLWEAMAAKDEKKAAECHAELKRLSAEKVGE
jgi:hypothetical protein